MCQSCDENEFQFSMTLTCTIILYLNFALCFNHILLAVDIFTILYPYKQKQHLLQGLRDSQHWPFVPKNRVQIGLSVGNLCLVSPTTWLEYCYHVIIVAPLTLMILQVFNGGWMTEGIKLPSQGPIIEETDVLIVPLRVCLFTTLSLHGILRYFIS